MSDLEVSVRVDAPPERVWALLGDPTRMGEWSPECRQVTWIGRTRTPAVGARFVGLNGNGWRRWPTFGTVVAHEPNREVAWDVSVGPFPIARWGYRIVPDEAGAGCTVVETFDDHRRGPVMHVVGPLFRGVREADVLAHNRAGMEATLARVKAAAEAASADRPA